MTLDEESQKRNRKRVLVVAKDTLDGIVGIIEGSRMLFDLRHTVTEDSFDPDFNIFVLVASETDHLPIGEVRKYWAPDSLAQKDIEIKETEEFYRNDVKAGCRKLIQRFSGTA